MHELRIPILGYAALLLAVFLLHYDAISTVKYHLLVVGVNW